MSSEPLGSPNDDSPHSHDRDLDHKTRLRKACDSCSVRKVKCDESGPPCQPCAALNIPCTWERPTRRRGPPNRHAEAIKRQRLMDTAQEPTPSPARTPSAQSSHSLSIESICPLVLLHPLIDDYFTYLHPLVPLPHEPTFREALARRDDLHSSSFLGLVATMIGALVVSFPRKPRLHLKAQGQEHLFPKSVNLLDRCHSIAIEARGLGFMDKAHNINDATTSYLLGLICAYSYRYTQCKLYFTECAALLRILGMSRPHNSDYITRELLRRLFWVLFAGIQSFYQVGLPSGELFMPPSTIHDAYPPLPIEVDDRYITTDHIGPQPADVISELVGFNANIRVYRSYETLDQLDLVLALGRPESWSYQTQVMQTSLHLCKTAFDGLPPELLLRPGQQSGDFGSGLPRSPEILDQSQQRRRIQYEIQKANIYVSQLGIRTHLVDRYWALYDAHDHIEGGGSEAIAATIAAERESVVHDLLLVLHSISQVNMEPNGPSLVQKIRAVASTLMDVPGDRKGNLAVRVQHHLAELVDMLMKLERVPRAKTSESDPRSPNSMLAQAVTDEETELQHWADFRDVQARFAEKGGVLLF